AQVSEIGARLEAVGKDLEEVQGELEALLLDMPNTPHESVPDGQSEEDNVEVRRWGQPPNFEFKPLDHVALGAMHGMDFEAASKIAGSRFVVLRGELARLQRAL